MNTSKIFTLRSALFLSILWTISFSACISDKARNSEAKKEIIEEKKTDIIENKSSTTQPTLEDAVISFKSATKAKLLKDMLIVKLKNNTEKQDVLLTQFLSNYENLLMKETFDIDKMSVSEVEELGYAIYYSEGDRYLGKNTVFIKDGIIQYLNPLSSKFINLYCEDIDNPCCEDAGLSISRETLVQRVFNWGLFADESKSTAFSDIAEASYSSYKFILFNGLDNTPAFDFETNKFNQEALSAMEEVELNHLNTRAGRAFEEYIDVLFGEEFLKTDVVQEYLDDLFE